MKLTVHVHPTSDGFSLSDYLNQELLIPRKVRHFLRTRKNVKVNGVVVPFHTPLKTGDTLDLEFLEEDYPLPNVLCSKSFPLDILYEDEHLIIVDKKQGMKTHPNEPTENDTLLNIVANYLHQKKQIPYVVHRLDKETSGLVLFAKNPVVLPILGKMMEKKEIHRKYQAIVEGSFSKKEFTIQKKIGRDRHDRRKRIVDEKNGQKAITHVQVKKEEKNRSFLEITLDTGRTHQIRVHLSSLNHPIVGDPLYQRKKDKSPLALRAISLTFLHPFTKEEICIISPKKLF